MVPDQVRVTFSECDAGCIFFLVEAAGQSVKVIASHIIDPFPAMIDWLHAVVDGATFCHWGVDEENRATSFLLARRPDGLARLLVCGFQPLKGAWTDDAEHEAFDAKLQRLAGTLAETLGTTIKLYDF